jgi:hypothetical protein
MKGRLSIFSIFNSNKKEQNTKEIGVTRNSIGHTKP